MRTINTASILLALMASAANGISLSNFTPKVDGLPSQCNDVYNRQIIGCLAQDFNQNTRCSPNCVNGLIEIQKAIGQGCKDVDVSETSIVGVFLAGNGIPALCRGVTVTTISSNGAAQTTSQQSSTPQQSSSAQPPPSSSAAQSSTSQAAATSIANIPPAAGPAPTSAAQPQQSPPSRPNPSPTAQNQKSNKDSGGGSPFDVQSTGGADRRLGETTMALTIGLIILSAFL